MPGLSGSYQMIRFTPVQINNSKQILKNKQHVAYLKQKGPIYIWRTLTGVNWNKNRTQYSSPEIFWQCNQDTELKLH